MSTPNEIDGVNTQHTRTHNKNQVLSQHFLSPPPKRGRKKEAIKCENTVHVSKFVSDGKSSAQSVVLNDGARIGTIAHGTKFSKSKRIALLHLRIATNVLSAPDIK